MLQSMTGYGLNSLQIDELEIYAKLVTKNSYCIVFDTIIEDLPKVYGKNRSWGKNDNPKSALKKYLEKIRQKSFFDLKSITLFNNLSFEIPT